MLSGGGIALWWSVCDPKTWPCGAGYLECRGVLVLVPGVPVCWLAGVLVRRSAAALECCCSGVLLGWIAGARRTCWCTQVVHWCDGSCGGRCPLEEGAEILAAKNWLTLTRRVGWCPGVLVPCSVGAL